MLFMCRSASFASWGDLQVGVLFQPVHRWDMCSWGLFMCRMLETLLLTGPCFAFKRPSICSHVDSVLLEFVEFAVVLWNRINSVRMDFSLSICAEALDNSMILLIVCCN
ncbi:hypothetical protein Droror1_Dr00012496 [Drosera rotundifolia]